MYWVRTPPLAPSDLYRIRLDPKRVRRGHWRGQWWTDSCSSRDVLPRGWKRRDLVWTHNFPGPFPCGLILLSQALRHAFPIHSPQRTNARRVPSGFCYGQRRRFCGIVKDDLYTRVGFLSIRRTSHEMTVNWRPGSRRGAGFQSSQCSRRSFGWQQNTASLTSATNLSTASSVPTLPSGKVLELERFLVKTFSVHPNPIPMRF